MPDASGHRFPASGWSDAFAALPAETPPPGGWERVARAMPVRRRRWPALVALAAALALVAVVPLRWSRQEAPAPTVPVASVPTTTERAAATQPAPAVAVELVPVEVEARSPANIDADRPGAIASAADEARDASSGPAQAATSTQPDNAATDAPQVATAQPREAIEPPATPPELERLYAESAQFEGLLALARDARGEVANGAVAMLSDDLATRVARIDAALMQPALTGERRLALWRERVDALRQAAAFESTQRLLAARGEQYDAMLVSID